MVLKEQRSYYGVVLIAERYCIHVQNDPTVMSRRIWQNCSTDDVLFEQIISITFRGMHATGFLFSITRKTLSF